MHKPYTMNPLHDHSTDGSTISLSVWVSAFTINLCKNTKPQVVSVTVFVLRFSAFTSKDWRSNCAALCRTALKQADFQKAICHTTYHSESLHRIHRGNMSQGLVGHGGPNRWFYRWCWSDFMGGYNTLTQGGQSLLWNKLWCLPNINKRHRNYSRVQCIQETSQGICLRSSKSKDSAELLMSDLNSNTVKINMQFTTIFHPSVTYHTVLFLIFGKVILLKMKGSV